MREKDVIKHSSTIQISNKISLLQRKAWNVLLANAYDDLPTKNRYQVSVIYLLEVLQIKTRNIKYLKEIIKDLMSVVVEFNLLDKDDKNEWHATTLLSYVVIKNGICSYEYSSFLREILYSPAIYARIKLSMQNKFSSKHTLALYELCIDYFIEKRGYGTTPFIEIEKFRELMGFKENEYTIFKDLSKYIIKKSILEINNKTDIFVEQEYKKCVRKVVAIKFSIKPNPENKDKEISLLFQEIDKQETNNMSPISSKSELFERLQKYFCLSPSQAQKVLGTYDKNYILENLTYIETKINRGEIQNIGAYTLKALQEDYRNQKSQFDIEKEKRQKQNQKEEYQKEREEKQKAEHYRYQRIEAEKYKESLSPQELQQIEVTIKKEVSKEIENQKSPDFTLPLLVRIEIEKYLIEQSGALSFEQWQKKQKVQQ